MSPDLHHYKHNVSLTLFEKQYTVICKTLNTLNIHYTQKSIMKSRPCNTKALTVKLPHRPTNWFNTVIRCANTCLLNCRHNNQVCKHYKKQ